MSDWSFDTGAVVRTFELQPPFTNAAGQIAAHRAGSVSVDLGAPSVGTAFIEKIETVRLVVDYTVNSQQHANNDFWFTFQGVAPRSMQTQPYQQAYVPEIVFHGLAIPNGPSQFDRTFVIEELGRFRAELGDPSAPLRSALSSEIYQRPKLEARASVFSAFRVTVTRAQLFITATRVGVDSNNNGTSAREEDLSGWVR